jgi:hypothetical protein
MFGVRESGMPPGTGKSLATCIGMRIVRLESNRSLVGQGVIARLGIGL